VVNSQQRCYATVSPLRGAGVVTVSPFMLRVPRGGVNASCDKRAVSCYRSRNVSPLLSLDTTGHIQWHVKDAWRELLWSDEEPDARWSRDPVAPAKRSTRSDLHSFRTLLSELATLVRNTCRRRGAPSDEATFPMNTIPNPKRSNASRPSPCSQYPDTSNTTLYHSQSHFSAT